MGKSSKGITEVKASGSAFLGVTIPKDMYLAVDTFAGGAGMSRSEAVRTLVTLGFETLEKAKRRIRSA